MTTVEAFTLVIQLVLQYVNVGVSQAIFGASLYLLVKGQVQ